MTQQPAIVLIHGALGARSQLEPLAAALSATHRVHVVELEGHGSTAGKSRPFRMEHFVENVLAALEANAVERASLFGYSMGGYVALMLAAAHPHRVERVITLGTKFRWDVATASREAGRLDADAIRSKVPQFAATLRERHANAGGWEGVLSKTAEMLQDLGENPRLTKEVLRSISVPVTLLVGGRDNTVSIDETRGVSRVLRDASFAVLDNTVHPIEQVDVSLLVDAITAT